MVEDVLSMMEYDMKALPGLGIRGSTIGRWGPISGSRATNRLVKFWAAHTRGQGQICNIVSNTRCAGFTL